MRSSDRHVLRTSRRLRAHLRRLAAAGLVGLGIAAASSALTATTQGCASDPAPKPQGSPIVFGVTLGLTNSLAGTAAPVRDAIRVAESQINANGGVLGRPVFFDIQDDTSDGDKAIEVAEKFVKDGVVAVIGPIGSGQVVKVAKIYADANIIQISPTATSVDLTNIQPESDRWFFRTTPADDFQGAAVLRFAELTPKGLGDGGAAVGEGGVPVTCTNLAIVNIDNSYGKSMGDLIEKNFARKSGKIVLREPIAEKLASNYEDVANRIINAQPKPQCMAIIAYEDTGAAVITELKANANFATLGQDFFIIGTDGIFTDGFLVESRQDKSNPTSKNSADGVYGTNPDTQPGTREYNEFRTIYSSAIPVAAGEDAPAFTANAYDAAVLVALAVQRAGSLADRKVIRDALFEVSNRPGTPYTPASLGAALLAAKEGQDIDWKGASGAVDFEPNGNVKSGFIIWQAAKQTDGTLTYRTVGRFSLDDLVGQLQ